LLESEHENQEAHVARPQLQHHLLLSVNPFVQQTTLNSMSKHLRQDRGKEKIEELPEGSN